MGNLKDKRIAAATALENGVTTREKLFSALPALVNLKKTLESAKETNRQCQEVVNALSEACSKYASEHPSVFDNGLVTIRDSVQAGDITIEETVYHFTTSPGAPKLASGDAMTQTFLQTLPEEFRKSSFRIAANKATDEELAQYGLVRGMKNEWSLGE